MRLARTFLLLAFAFLAGCLAQTYPGVVVGNPDVDDPPAPSKPGEIDPEELPDPGQAPLPFEPPAPDGNNPSSPSPIENDPQEIYADPDDPPPGGDRVTQDPDAPVIPSRPEHADIYEEAPGSMTMIQN